MPRPPIQHHKFVLELSKDLQQQLEDVKEISKLALIAGVVGRFVSTPVGALVVTGLGLTAALSYRPTRRLAADFIGFWRNQITELIVHIQDAFIPTAGNVSDAIVRRVLEALQLKEKEERGETPDCPPGQHVEFVTTPAGLVATCVPDEIREGAL